MVTAKTVKTKELNEVKTNSNGGLSSLGLMVFNALVSRSQMASRVGTQSYGGERDIYQALGYKDKLEFEDYVVRYFRQDMAKAVIDRPVNASWKGELTIIENTKTKKTKFEKQFADLYMRLKLKSIFVRVDKLAGLGRYAVLMLGTNDVTSTKSFENKIKKGSKLLYVKPYSEKTAKIEKWNDNPKSSRYGLPELYRISQQPDNLLVKAKSTYRIKSKADDGSNSILVHHSRIVHITEDILEDETFGLPALEVVFNRLMDLEKIVGGDAEMFWRGARPGYTGNVKPDYELTTKMREELDEQIKDFEHNLIRVLINEGIDYKSLEQQIADPTNHVDVQVQMISAVRGIPKRILIGSERGELSSAQDKQEWDSYVSSRREEVNEPAILRPFVDRLVEYGIVEAPKDNKYTVVWDKLFSLSDKEKVELGKNRAIALKEYSTNPAAQYMLPYDMFLKFLMGFDDYQMSIIADYRKELFERTGQKELSLKEIAELNQAAKRQFERTSSNDSRTESGANKKKEDFNN